MFAASNVVLFTAEHRYLFGDRAPFIIANAFRAAEAAGLRGMFSSGELEQVFEGNLNAMRGLQGAVEDMDLRHLHLAFGQAQLGLDLILLALFGMLPPELEPLISADPPDIMSLPVKIGEVLRAQGVDWKDDWIKIG